MSEPRIWMVTGAGRGLGRSIALAAASAGERVIATGRDESNMPEHPLIVRRRLDVRERSEAHSVVRSIVEEFGQIDVLVNNAGYGLIGAVEEVDEDSVRAIIETNFTGALWLSQAVIPYMRTQGQGHLVFVSTTGAVGTMPTLGLYNASKWALEGMAEALAGEVSDFGIRVGIVEPGAIDTEWATSSMRFAPPDPAYDGLRERLFGTASVPWPASGTGGGTHPDTVANAIVRHVTDPTDRRLRVLSGDDAPSQVAAALSMRLADYNCDPRFSRAMDEYRTQVDQEQGE